MPGAPKRSDTMAAWREYFSAGTRAQAGTAPEVPPLGGPGAGNPRSLFLGGVGMGGGGVGWGSGGGANVDTV